MNGVRMNHPFSTSKEDQKLLQLKNAVLYRRNNQPFDPPIEDYVQITREERNARDDELISESFCQRAVNLPTMME